MDASDSPIGTVTRTPARGWAVLLLFRAQGSSVILISYTFGQFLRRKVDPAVTNGPVC